MGGVGVWGSTLLDLEGLRTPPSPRFPPPLGAWGRSTPLLTLPSQGRDLFFKIFSLFFPCTITFFWSVFNLAGAVSIAHLVVIPPCVRSPFLLIASFGSSPILHRVPACMTEGDCSGSGPPPSFYVFFLLVQDRRKGFFVLPGIVGGLAKYLMKFFPESARVRLHSFLYDLRLFFQGLSREREGAFSRT